MTEPQPNRFLHGLALGLFLGVVPGFAHNLSEISDQKANTPQIEEVGDQIEEQKAQFDKLNAKIDEFARKKRQADVLLLDSHQQGKKEDASILAKEPEL